MPPAAATALSVRSIVRRVTDVSEMKPWWLPSPHMESLPLAFGSADVHQKCAPRNVGVRCESGFLQRLLRIDPARVADETAVPVAGPSWIPPQKDRTVDAWESA
jgi:hypothetical protein